MSRGDGEEGVGQSDRERLETRFWSESADEAPGADSVRAVANKLAEARVVFEKFESFEHELRDAHTILELGGGQCWVSCLLKKEFGPGNVVLGSDIAADAVASIPEWERIFRVQIDGGMACRSYEIPMRADSVDLVVVFAAAHHFGAHRRTLEEIARVLRGGGRALYLHEPACQPLLHRLARRRVMAKRPVVPEDVLVYRRLERLAARAGLETRITFAPTTTDRGPIQTLYYLILSKLPFLQHVLPCSVDFAFIKPAPAVPTA